MPRQRRERGTSYRPRSNNAEHQAIEAYKNQGFDILTRGWPDFVAFKDGQIIFVEVKPEGTQGLRAAQRKMAELFSQVGLEIVLHRSSCRGVTPRTKL